MAVEATVLIPTHNHGHLLGYSVQSALEQSVSDIEVFIVGDGMDDTTRAEALEMARSDRRVRVFDNPKGPRHGEVHRHQALQEASGEIVCYLADDDLWLSEHVETMAALLEGVDFAHALPVGIWPDGTVMSWVGHLEVESSRSRVIALENFIPLSCGAHTMEAYRRLPQGWRTTPGKTPTDVYMWSQILDLPGCRSRSGDRLTVLHFPSPWRGDMTPGQRVTELEGWRTLMGRAGFEAELTARTVSHLTHHRAMMDEWVRELEQKAEALEGMVGTGRDAFLTLESQLKDNIAELLVTQEKLAELDERRVELEAALDWSRVELAETHQELEAQRHGLEAAREREVQLRMERDMMLGSLTWRVRNRLLRIPGVARAARWVGEARSRRGAQ